MGHYSNECPNGDEDDDMEEQEPSSGLNMFLTDGDLDHEYDWDYTEDILKKGDAITQAYKNITSRIQGSGNKDALFKQSESKVPPSWTFLDNQSNC
jgi:hypothetical protein